MKHTILGPYLSVITPAKIPSHPPSTFPKELAAAVAALDHPNSADNGLKKTPNP
jgi:hypothetical protein